jgi:hypothetical protein
MPFVNSLKCTLGRDLATRKETREKAWQRDGWAETVSKVTIYISYPSDSY